MRILIVLQARMSSSRLPAKAMLSIAGRPMVVLAAQRAGNTGHDVVVATSDRPEDEIIATAVSDVGIEVVRGALDDPLSRFDLAAAGLDDDDILVRLTADNVVPDGELIDFMVSGMLGLGLPYVLVGGDDSTVPYGVAAEAFTAGALREVNSRATTVHDREHVTSLLRSSFNDYRLHVHSPSPLWAGTRCTVDTFDDYVRLSRVFADMSDPVNIGWRTICDRLGPAPRAPIPARRSNSSGQDSLVLGTVQLGLAYGAASREGVPSSSTAADVLNAAQDEGVTHFDTARAYGDSERRLGEAFIRNPQTSAEIITKVLPLDEISDDAQARRGRSAVLASVHQSLRALQRSSVSALLVHRYADWGKPGIRDALLELRSEGVTRLVGASVSSPTELVELLADAECGYVQMPFNLLDRRWLESETQAALAGRPDVLVTVRSVFLQGLLVAGQAARWPTNVRLDQASLNARINVLVQELERQSQADLCLAYALAHEWVTSVVVGAETPEQVHDVARLMREAPLSMEDVARVQQVLPSGTPTLVDPSRWRWT